MESSGKTIFLDIDGTLFKHQYDATGACFDPGWKHHVNATPDDWYLLEGVKSRLNEWSKKDYRIIIVTARRESMRKITERQLRHAGLFWDLLIMGIGNGERILVNDRSNRGDPKAFAINLVRDEGFPNINKIYNEEKKRLLGKICNETFEI